MNDYLFCRTHGMFHYLPGDPDCQFEDGFGNDIDLNEVAALGGGE